MSKRELAFYLNPKGPDRRAIMEALAEAGIRLLGVDGFPWHPDTNPTEYELFQAECDQYGLSVYSMHAVSPLLATADADVPPDLAEAQKRDLERLLAIHGKTAVYHACWMRDVPPEQFDTAIEKVGWESFVQRSADAIRPLARRAAEAGITVVLENIWHSVHAETVTGFIDIVRAVEEPNIGILLDSGHANLAGHVVADEIRAAGPLLKDTHFHDNAGPRNGELFDQHIPPGLGTIDWQEACRALDDIDFPGPVVFEGVLGPGDSIEDGRFGGKLSHRDLIQITIANWRAFEALAEKYP